MLFLLFLAMALGFVAAVGSGHDPVVISRADGCCGECRRASDLNSFEWPAAVYADTACELRKALENTRQARRSLFHAPADLLRDDLAALNFTHASPAMLRAADSAIFSVQMVLRAALPVRAGPSV